MIAPGTKRKCCQNCWEKLLAQMDSILSFIDNFFDLIFSQNTLHSHPYYKNTLNICSMIEATNNDKPLEKGFYFVNVFHGNRLLKSSTFELK